jgi:peptide/nickel transport system permease protein
VKLWIYIVRRAILAFPVVIGVMTLTFALVSAVPTSERLVSYYGPSPRLSYNQYISCSRIDPNLNGTCLNPAWVRGTHALGLDRPIYVQWGIYMLNTFEGKWGFVGNGTGVATSVPLAQGKPVATALGWFLPYTLELAALSLFMTLLMAVPLGNIAAVNRNRPVDQVSRIISFSGIAIPEFLLGSILLMAVVLLVGGPSVHSPFCSNGSAYTDFTGSWPPPQCFPGGVYPKWLVQGQISSPTGFPTVDAALHGQGWLATDTVIRMIIPAFVIAFGTAADLLRFVRNGMLEVLNLEFVRSARARGLPERVVIKKHAGRNSLNVTVTVLGLLFVGFLGGFPIIEYLFDLNGVGIMLAYAVTQTPYDFGVIFGSTVLFTIIIVVANLAVDLTYAYLDPRVRLG